MIRTSIQQQLTDREVGGRKEGKALTARFSKTEKIHAIKKEDSIDDIMKQYGIDSTD